MALELEAVLPLLERWGYLIVFLAAVAEALPLVGFFVPGQAVIILAGAASAAALLDVRYVILAAIPAGIFGDALGYHLGRHYGRGFLERHGHRFGVSERHLARSDELFAKYGAFALIVARFSFLTRAIGPVLGGVSRMRPALFWPINVVGAIAWAVAYALLGYFFGVSFLLFQETFGRILTLSLLAAVAIYGLYRLLRKQTAQFTRDDLAVALLGAAAATAFGFVAETVRKAGPMNVLDVYLGAFEQRLAFARPLWEAAEFVGSLPVLGGLALLAFVVLAARHLVWESTLVALGVGGAAVAVAITRLMFDGLLPPGPGDAFPSMHATLAVVAAGVVTYLVAERSGRHAAPLVAAVGTSLAAVVLALSRVAQAEEYPTGVFGGIAFGTAWLSVSILVVEFGLKRQPEAM